MVIDHEAEGLTMLRLAHPDSGMVLMMQHNPQTDEFCEVLTKPGNTVETINTGKTRRHVGVSNQVFFDRACLHAYQSLMTHVQAEVEKASRFEQMEEIHRQIRATMHHMEQTFAHWENDELTENELNEARRILGLVNQADALLTELS